MSYYNLTHSAVREYAGGSIGGILRKGGGSTASSSCSMYASSTPTPTAALNAGEARQVDLLVFGYACKVFRDDDKARDIDQGKHLIPWMGDATLKIDRYDVRGALSELALHEPPPGGYGNRLDYLSADEQRAEQLCEEERYLYLYNNEEDDILRQEEDLKRLKQDCEGGSYAQVDFQYGSDAPAAVPHGPNREEQSNSPNADETDQPFSLPNDFEVPASIQLPETMKQHAIIEKTARFIASQGMQMEILLKAKQSNNVQFDFLAINGVLNPYYKYLLNAIKNGTYPAESGAQTAKETAEQSLNNSSAPVESEPSVVPPKPIISVPTIKYKPSANCAYTQLISKIKGVPLPAVIDGDRANMPTSNSPTLTTSVSAAGGNFTPVLLQYNGNTYVSAESEDATNSHSHSNGNLKTEVEILKQSSALALAQNYASDTGSEGEEEQEKAPPIPKPEPVLNFPVPTETLKNIIDKTATYVVKNGRQFEETLRAKSVDRFTFLLHDNEYYSYYLYKVTGDPLAASKEQKQRKAAAVAAALMSKKGLQSGEKAISPVCFSIKMKEDSATAGLLPALPNEPSDDDEEYAAANRQAGCSHSRSVPEHVQKAIQLVESQLMARNAQIAAAVGSRSTATSASSALPAMRTSNPHTGSRFDMEYSSSGANCSTKTQLKSSKAEMERNALFEQQQQNRQKELKKAEEKVKDKLAQIAREKLGGLISKEKQLQLERKRKAMAFLNQIKGTPTSTTSAQHSPNGADKVNINDEDNVSDSEESVHSIPITSYGPEDDGKSDEEEKMCAIKIPITHIAGAVPIVTSSKSSTVALKSKPATTVTVSDDDDVQLVGEIRPLARSTASNQRRERKRHLRSHVRDSSPDALTASASAQSRKRQRQRRSRSYSQSSVNDNASSCSSTSTSSSTPTASSDSSQDSDDIDASESSRQHRTHKHSTKNSKLRKSTKSRKSSSRSHRKKKSKKRACNHERKKPEEYMECKQRIREQARKKKRGRQREEEYECENERRHCYPSENTTRHSSRSATPADAHYHRPHQRASVESRGEYERERTQRERRSQRGSKQRVRERSHTPSRRYDTTKRKEKKKKRDR